MEGADLESEVEERLRGVRRLLEAMGDVAVMLSGGVDSALLAALAHEALGRHAVAVTIESPLLSADERADAGRLAAQVGIRHKVLPMDELEDAGFVANPRDRCHLCKRMRLEAVVRWAAERGIPWVLDGANADDRGDYRPGMKALMEFGSVRSPLLEAGMTKAEVRAAARAMGLFTWNKPARACLASRIPYGEPVTAEALRRVEAAERFLAGILPPAAQFRVRAHGDLARVEAECRDLPRVLARREAVAEGLRAVGFRYVTLDLVGYRVGSLNEALDQGAAKDVQAPAGTAGAVGTKGVF
ncbi:ATP-dependent sacrificial sulfur transferase LarE [Fretibacterium fastidiosum]|uniref:Asparagine synthetase domain-containing protein n=1 Tax=Fretibacterium fastidiosum TaxID=651822 RepID=A0AB94IW64_9BACT|nr:ATP-dependent sacrificial sulfur transferase LarE [Fretibacterium fastidiosum]CBL28020.1 conserved hypothetical protein TIGR00268 [Fretibacterium fastidiosum]